MHMEIVLNKVWKWIKPAFLIRYRIYTISLFQVCLYWNFCGGIAAMITDHTYDMVDEFQMGNHSLRDIINLKQFHNLFLTFQSHRVSDFEHRSFSYCQMVLRVICKKHLTNSTFPGVFWRKNVAVPLEWSCSFLSQLAKKWTQTLVPSHKCWISLSLVPPLEPNLTALLTCSE